MSSESPTLLDRYLGLSRAMQWATLAAIGIALFMVWDSWISPIQAQLSRDADNIESQVREVRDSRKLADDLKKNELSEIVLGVGQVHTPRKAAAGSSSVFDIVNQLMKKHGITDQDFSLRTRGKLPKNVLVQVLAGKRGERLTGELKFSAKPEIAIAILADLESSPDIEQVSSVRLTKDQNGKIKVQYTLEAWVIASEGAAGPTGASL